MDEFNKDTGSLWDKTIAGLAGAAKRLMDFFVFDLMGLFEDGGKWVMKKFLGLFGYSEEEVEGMAWYKFSLTEYLREKFGDLVDLAKGILTWDTKLIAKGIKGLWGLFTNIVDWIFGTIYKPVLNWIGKNIFRMDEDQLMGDDFSLTGWINEKVIEPIWNVIKKIFDFD